MEYLDIPQEPPSVIESRDVPAYWPSTTSSSQDFIRVKDLVVRYAPDLDPVIHKVSFSLKAGEKIGLLGRTGSGKSTLGQSLLRLSICELSTPAAMSLLRFVDPSGGTIEIDGIDITTIGLRDLRSRVVCFNHSFQICLVLIPGRQLYLKTQFSSQER